MIVGIGIDIVELDRIRDSFLRNSRLAERVLTENELAVLRKLEAPGRQVEYLAGRFAAKEAYAKALGTGLGKLSFQAIEIMPDEQGAPQLKVKSEHNRNLFLSISHSREYAVAQVIIEA
ncbi:holo-ACP synthase [Sediminibacillus halophilus]|uniref:Holo-[acyl-carrier-protein] synthase n=1 Tax=Sediminibacillus halophilus TaxID=482461 RepID=A0A1G9WR07_9BACI|nr:holo-ACP synthase [Sediminibacillus halophilus]SDM86890.1 holo-[acyl-carrier protein] synthase [Sediminibacillus halophilus]